MPMRGEKLFSSWLRTVMIMGFELWVWLLCSCVLLHCDCARRHRRRGGGAFFRKKRYSANQSLEH